MRHTRFCMDCGRRFKPTGKGQYRCPRHQHLPDRRRDARRKARGVPQGGSRVPAAIRRAVLERDGYRCHWCQGPANTVDHHPVPLAHGGPSTAANLVASCGTCNSSRGATVRRPQ